VSFKFFLTGTDTNVGKTYIAVGLLKAFNSYGYSTLGIKPIASGSTLVNGKWINADAQLLQRVSSVQLDYSHINPFSFEAPIAPHIAADQNNVSLTVREVIAKIEYSLHYPCDVHIIEGVGGWSVPLNHYETMVDFVTHLQLPIILVVGIRLGCINHSILTYEAIKQKNLTCVGWVANCVEENVLMTDKIIDTLHSWISVPFLGTIPFGKNPEDFLRIDLLI